jgi:hypothetical protein
MRIRIAGSTTLEALGLRAELLIEEIGSKTKRSVADTDLPTTGLENLVFDGATVKEICRAAWRRNRINRRSVGQRLRWMQARGLIRRNGDKISM